MTEPFDLSAFLPYQLATVAARMSRGFADRYRTEFGLTIPEWRVLAHLAHAGTSAGAQGGAQVGALSVPMPASVSVREIQARVDMDKSKVSRAAARLETAGLIAKRAHPTDRRLLEMTLTPAGQDLMARIRPVALAYQADVLAQLGEDAAPFRRALARLREGGEA